MKIKIVKSREGKQSFKGDLEYVYSLVERVKKVANRAKLVGFVSSNKGVVVAIET